MRLVLLAFAAATLLAGDRMLPIFGVAAMNEIAVISSEAAAVSV
jgi:hypothetical protein